MSAPNNNPTSTDDTQTSAPKPCVKGCGFFGRPETEHMCSKCYRDHKSASSAQPASSSSVSTNKISQVLFACDDAVSANASSTSAPSATPSSAVKTQAEVQTQPNSSAMEVGVSSVPTDSKTAADDAAPSEPEPEPETQTDRTRCWKCTRKVGLVGIECRCGYVFCGKHRYANMHACAYDYKVHDRSQLSKANRTVRADKLTRVEHV